MVIANKRIPLYKRLFQNAIMVSLEFSHDITAIKLLTINLF